MEARQYKWNKNPEVTQFTIDGKQPPRTSDAEEYLLGCLMSESGAIDLISSITSDVFYSEPNKRFSGLASDCKAKTV